MDKRIHIVPVGYDYYSRVVEPLRDPRADRIFFIKHKKGAIRGHPKFFNSITKEIKKIGIEYKEIETDIWDLFECVEIFRKIISDEIKKENHVYINVSTGTKVTAMAGILACMMWDQTPYYVKLKNPTKKNIKTIPKIAVEDAEKLPTFDIKKPDYKMMKVLEKISSYKAEMLRKWQLTEYLEDEGIIKPADPDETFSENAKLGQLQNIIKPMEKEWKFVETESRGSRSQVKMTKKGKQALKIFGIPED